MHDKPQFIYQEIKWEGRQMSCFLGQIQEKLREIQNRGFYDLIHTQKCNAGQLWHPQMSVGIQDVFCSYMIHGLMNKVVF